MTEVVFIAGIIVTAVFLFKAYRFNYDHVTEEFASCCICNTVPVDDVPVIMDERKSFRIWKRGGLDTSNPRFFICRSCGYIWYKVMLLAVLISVIRYGGNTVPVVVPRCFFSSTGYLPGAVRFLISAISAWFGYKLHQNTLELRPADKKHSVPFNALTLIVLDVCKMEIYNSKHHIVIHRTDMESLMDDAVTLSNALGGLPVVGIAHHETK